jgi:predicted small metal-binding protein
MEATMSDQTRKWAVLDCGKYPSDNNCQIKMMAPADHLEDVLDIAVRHAIEKHGHQNQPELRNQLRTLITYEEQ